MKIIETANNVGSIIDGMTGIYILTIAFFLILTLVTNTGGEK